MKLTRQHRREARLLWQSVTVNNNLDADRARTAVQAVRKTAGRDAEAVLRCFAQRLAVYVRSNQVRITSADPLTAEQQEQLTKLTDSGASAGSGVRFAVDASVLGGLRLERGYLVTDRTLARQLDLLQDLILRN